MHAKLPLKYTCSILLLLGGWASPPSAWAASVEEGALDAFSRAPYLQLGTPRSMVVVWRTLGPIEPVLHYGRHHQRLDQVLPVRQIALRVSLPEGASDLRPEAALLNTPRYRRLPRLYGTQIGTVQYEARITGLRPDTRYYYAIYDGRRRLTPPDPSYTFSTHPPRGTEKPTRFWVVGDSGTGREPSFSIHHAMLRRVQVDRRPLDFYVHLGDMAYTDGKDHEFQRGFFNAYESTLRHTVCWPTMGNHEGHTSRGREGIGPYYDAYVVPTRAEAGGLASGTEAYYSFEYGHLHFICLDSYDLDRRPTGAMARWLKADLDRAKTEWVIAFWHHPPYTKGSHDSDSERELVEMREYIMPILEAGGVDLVMTGHSHIYERSMLVDGAYDTPTTAENVVFDDGDGDPFGDGAYRKSAGLKPHQGTVQVVAGNGGADLGRKGTMPIMKRVVVEHGSVIIDIDGDTLTGVMINKEGFERDRFSLIKRGVVQQTRIADPDLLPAYEAARSRRSGRSAQQPPDGAVPLIPQNAEWRYLAGQHPNAPSWSTLDFNAAAWRRGLAGFGYGNDQPHKTKLDGMRRNYSVLYLRKEFLVSNPSLVSGLGLMVNYDDAFIAYLNGEEILRKGIRQGSGKDVEAVWSHEADGHQFYPIENFRELLRPGRNVLAIEGHNRSLDSSDFTLDPYLLMEN